MIVVLEASVTALESVDKATDAVVAKESKKEGVC